VLVETGLSGISSLCVFWRIRVASVELIDRCHREDLCYSFYNGYLMQSFNGPAGSALTDHSSNSDELSGRAWSLRDRRIERVPLKKIGFLLFGVANPLEMATNNANGPFG
jgi:hypothetical protein